MSLRYTAEYIPPLKVVDLPLFRLTLGLLPLTMGVTPIQTISLPVWRLTLSLLPFTMESWPMSSRRKLLIDLGIEI